MFLNVDSAFFFFFFFYTFNSFRATVFKPCAVRICHKPIIYEHKLTDPLPRAGHDCVNHMLHTAAVLPVLYRKTHMLLHVLTAFYVFMHAYRNVRPRVLKSGRHKCLPCCTYHTVLLVPLVQFNDFLRREFSTASFGVHRSTLAFVISILISKYFLWSG